VLNALRTLKPQKKQVLVINFEPMEQQKFQQTLRIFSEYSEVSVQLEGRGVKYFSKPGPRCTSSPTTAF
jgi:hypothetical protein